MTKDELIVELTNRLNPDLEYDRPGSDDFLSMFMPGVLITGREKQPPKTRGEEVAEKMVRITANWLAIDNVFVLLDLPPKLNTETAEELLPLVRRAIAKSIDDARREERGRCAKIAEESEHDVGNQGPSIAAAIRGRE